MSFEIDGETWVPETTAEHSEKWMNSINSILEENDVRDANGNIIKLSMNFANALYLFVLSGANRLSDNDKKLQQAINSFNVELCDDQQIENLLPIAAISRNPGSYSTLNLTCTAESTGSCYIPRGTKAPFGSVNFVVQNDTLISAGETQNVPTVCDTIGAVAVLQGEITAFDVQIPNLQSVTNYASSIPGNAAETTDSLRRRIIRGETVPYSLDGVKLALEELQGINHARVYFNFNVSTIYTLPGGIVLQPRTAYIVVNGDSEKLAETYARYMSAPTQNAPGASPTGTYTTVKVFVTAAGAGAAVIPAGTTFHFDNKMFASDAELTVPAGETDSVQFTAAEVGAITIPSGYVTHFDQQIDNVSNVSNAASVPGVPKTAYEQDYTTGSGQTIPIRYDKAGELAIFVRIVLEPGDNNDTDEIRNQLKRDLIESSASWVIGENITSLKTSAPFENCLYTDVSYTQVSLDGETWGNRIEIPANVVPHVSDSSIIIGGL